MGSRETIKLGMNKVRPVLSQNQSEARKRVFDLYKAWYRTIPYIRHHYHIPKTQSEIKQRIRQEFYKNANLRDIRAIDLLVIKGQNDLKEIVERWQQECHLMYYWMDTAEPKPKDFLSKFMSGQD